MTEDNSTDLSQTFLENFIRTIIENVTPQEKFIDPLLTPIEDQNQILKIIPNQQFQRTSSVINNLMPQIQTNQIQKFELTSPLSYQSLNPRVLTADPRQNLMPSVVSDNSQQKSTFQFSRQETIKPINLRPFPTSTITPVFAFKKIDQLLNNPAIMSVECQGPGKNLIVNRGGMVKATPISLTQAEIDEIMNDISSKTRIPIIKGVFKAALGNLIISAVISDFVGTRFHIEKMRRPMHQMQ